MAQRYYHIIYRRVGFTLNGSLEVITWRVCFVGQTCWIWPGIYKSSLTQPSKTIIIFHAEVIEVVISNLHPVTTNRVIIIGSIFKIVNKVPDKVLVPKRKGFQFLDGCFFLGLRMSVSEILTRYPIQSQPLWIKVFQILYSLLNLSTLIRTFSRDSLDWFYIKVIS